MPRKTLSPNRGNTILAVLFLDQRKASDVYCLASQNLFMTLFIFIIVIYGIDTFKLIVRNIREYYIE